MISSSCRAPPAAAMCAGMTISAAVRTRLAEYHTKTAPILPYYDAQRVVTHVDGMADMDHVAASIEAVLARAKANAVSV